MAPRSLPDQMRQTLANVEAIVCAAGGTPADIVPCTVYIADLAQWGVVNEIYAEYFRAVPTLPARVMVPVKELHYGALIEIQAVAFLG